MNDVNTTLLEPEVVKTPKEEHFFPIGAIVFFVILVILCIAFWFSIYWLMIGRI
jgi:hypothetical protein